MKAVTLVILLSLFMLVKNICDSCLKNNVPCMQYIAPGIEKYCNKQGNTAVCFCDFT